MKRNQFKTEGMKKGKPILWGIAIVSMVCLLSSVPRVTFAQEKYPTRPIEFIIGFPPGGTTDICARPLVSAASKILGQPVMVLNKPGASSVIAVTFLKTEKPNGYTIGVLPSSAVLSQHMRKVPYDSAQDFTPIMQYSIYTYGLVVQSDSPWKSFKEFIDYAKANPGKIRYGTAGIGTPQHLVMERIALQENIKWTCIPFDGGPPALGALLGGHVEAVSLNPEWKNHVKSGRLRLLAVYGEKRMIDHPNAPTLLELGYKMPIPSLIAIIGPKGLPPQVVDTLHGAFKKAMDDPDFIKISNQVDQPIVYRGPQDLGKHLVQMNEEIETIIRKLGLRKE
jgi:tripartite-type tricarboxylate transporter receptor subunit TctC